MAVAVIVGGVLPMILLGGRRLLVEVLLPEDLVRFSHSFKLELLELRCNRMGILQTARMYFSLVLV